MNPLFGLTPPLKNRSPRPSGPDHIKPSRLFRLFEGHARSILCPLYEALPPVATRSVPTPAPSFPPSFFFPLLPSALLLSPFSWPIFTGLVCLFSPPPFRLALIIVSSFPCPANSPTPFFFPPWPLLIIYGSVVSFFLTSNLAKAAVRLLFHTPSPLEPVSAPSREAWTLGRRLPLLPFISRREGAFS